MSGRSLRMTGWMLAAALLLANAGCVSAWWNSFLNPTELGNFRHNVEKEVLETISFRDKPTGIANAVDPTPDDLVPVVEQYRVGPGDVVQVTISDFVRQGLDYEFIEMVNELGGLDVPQLGMLDVNGLTAQEIREEIAIAAVSRGIYQDTDTPIIRVVVGNQQHRRFSILGAVVAPNEYTIPRSDFRLLDAINLAGGLDDLVKTIYVSRRMQPGESVDEPLARQQPRRADRDQALAGIVNPENPLTPLGQEGANQSSTELAVPAEGDDQDLLEAIAPPEVLATAPSDSDDPSSTEPTAVETDELPDLPPFSFVPDSVEAPEPGREDEWVDEDEVDWEELAVEGKSRVISIPADRLRNFDSSYNIVIRHGDQIRVDPGPVGFYYMAGHVMRPGSYSLTGQELTLTQAIAAAGGLDQLAWPTRCEIRRQIDDNREEITQWDLARIVEGKDPNIRIKPNDEINVGTHAIAPLLATIRNSFRLTYGFGFVYDRNFADIDSFFGARNPEDIRALETAARFPGLEGFFD